MQKVWMREKNDKFVKRNVEKNAGRTVMEEALKISVIIPVYNADKYLDTCITSIINQTYYNLEIIIIDDGSSDDSLSICKKYEERDARIRLFHQSNRGLVYTRCFGFDMATGDYITFVDADDYIDLSTVKDVVDLIDDSEPDIIAYGLVEEYENSSKLKVNKFQDGLYNRERLIRDVFPSMLSYGNFFDFGILPNLVCKWIKKTFLKQASYKVSEIVTVGEDVDFSFQLIAQANKIQFLNITPYHYCKRDGSMMWKEIGVESINSLYKDLSFTFTNFKLKILLDNQLDEYITFVKLLKCPRSVDALSRVIESFSLRFALYGSGGFGQAIYEQYKKYISMWVDKDYERYKKKNVMVESPDCLRERENDFDYIFIAILNVDLCEMIKKDLREMGINKEIRYFLTSNTFCYSIK